MFLGRYIFTNICNKIKMNKEGIEGVGGMSTNVKASLLTIVAENYF